MRNWNDTACRASRLLLAACARRPRRPRTLARTRSPMRAPAQLPDFRKRPAADAGSPAPDAGMAASCPAGHGQGVGHVVIVIQENHTFDTYSGSGARQRRDESNMTSGTSCCEAGPQRTPKAHYPSCWMTRRTATTDAQPISRIAKVPEMGQRHDG